MNVSRIMTKIFTLKRIEMVRYIIIPLALLGLLFQLPACSSSGEIASGEQELQTVDEHEDKPETISVPGIRNLNSSVPLYSHLRKLPGVMVSTSGGATQVRLRGVNTIAGNNSPLYVIDGARIGFNYSAASSSVSVDEIDYINVLKGTDATQRYGGDGTSGVIEIYTRKG